jgi:hypothetical protein
VVLEIGKWNVWNRVCDRRYRLADPFLKGEQAVFVKRMMQTGLFD